MGCLDFLLPPRLAEAEIRVLDGTAQGRVLQVAFVLKTFKLEKKNEYTETPIAGLNGQPLQFVHGRPRRLSMVLYFDGRDTGTDVLQPMTDVAGLMSVDPDTHAPPVLRFQWQSLEIPCVLESVRKEFSSLHSTGRPSRGRMHVRFTERKTPQQLVEESRRE